MQRAWACAAAALLACGSSGSPLPEPSSSPGITAPAATPAPPPATPGAPTPIAGPAPSDPFHGVPAAPEDSGCHPLAERHCFLPYPSNWFSRRDGATATGLRPRVPDGIVGEDVLRDLAPEFHPGALLTPSDGFASAGPILFALPAPLDRGSLPPDGGKAAADAAVVVFDLDTGERIPVRAEPSDYAASRAVREPRTLVQVFPRGRFAYGHHYVAAVTRALRPQAAGLSYPIPSLWRAALAGSAEPAAAYHAPLLAFLGAQGVDASRIIALTDFTVRSEAHATAPTLRLM